MAVAERVLSRRPRPRWRATSRSPDRTPDPLRPRMEPLILVVEDDRPTRDAMRALLVREGYRVVCAADGREALDFLSGPEAPAAILLDLALPGLSGGEFRDRQRRDPALAGIPVLLVSGEAALAGAAASLGTAGYFPKPVEVEDLLRALRTPGEGPARPSDGRAPGGRRQQPLQVRQVERLEQEGVEARLVAPSPVLRLARPRGRHEQGLFQPRQPAEAAGHLAAVQARQADVQQSRLRAERAGQFQGGRPVVRGPGVVPPHGQE